MARTVSDEIQHDPLAQAIARALALANEVAADNGMNRADTRVAITEESSDAGLCWQIYYAPREYLNTRGGDLFVFVDRDGKAVQRVLYGQ
jgi:hypothetical protein